MTHEEAVRNYERVCAEVYKDETWPRAMNEMSREVNTKFFAAVDELVNATPATERCAKIADALVGREQDDLDVAEEIAARIRSGA